MTADSLSPPFLLIFYCLLVLLAALGGGWLIMALKLSHTRLQMALSAVAGLMLGIALLHFIPHSVHQTHSVSRTMQWVLGGFLVMFFLQRIFHYHHHHTAENQSPPAHLEPPLPMGDHHATIPLTNSRPAEAATRHLSWEATTIGLSLHSLADGVALASAAWVIAPGQSCWAGLGVALAVILHKPFGAMAISTLMTASGCSRLLRQLINLLFALVTPLAALVVFFEVVYMRGASELVVGSALAFCAGTFLCIACADLLPELQFHSHDRLKLSLSLLAGLAIALLLEHHLYCQSGRTTRKTMERKEWIPLNKVIRDIQAHLHTRADYIEKLARLPRSIQPDKVQLNTVDRPPAGEFALAVPPERMKEWAALFNPPAEVVAEFRGKTVDPQYKVNQDCLLNLLRRRPCAVSEIAASLGWHPHEIVKVLAQLEARGEIMRSTLEGGLHCRAVIQPPLPSHA